MDNKIIINSIGKHLDSLETIVSWVIILAIPVAWAGIQKYKTIELVGIKFNRRNAFYSASTLYLIANMAIAILFLRIGDLILLLKSKENIISGITSLFTHPWVLNPFSFFGSSNISAIHSNEGYGLLIATWWLCTTSLSTLMDDKKNKIAYVLLFIFIVVGLFSMLSIQRIYNLVENGIKLSDPLLFAHIKDNRTVRVIGAFLGIGLGTTFFTIVTNYQNRYLQSEA